MVQKTLQPIPEGKLKEAFGAMEHPRDFRPFVPPKLAPPELNSSRRDRTDETMISMPHVSEVHDEWGALMREPFRGLAADGKLEPLDRSLEANDAPRAEMEAATEAFLKICRPEILSEIQFAAEANEWRRWHNMPLQWERDGVGFEEMNDDERQAMLGVLKASLSAEGYSQVVDLMHINRFSGDLIGRVKYLNEWCYQVGIFGSPGDDIWGWQIYGHHLCLNCLLIGETYVLSPLFLAAEPSVVDEGQYKGAEVFVENEEAGLELIRGMSEQARNKAVILDSILNEDVPEGRRHWADSLHLGGAFQDNRDIPLEGICASELTDDDKTRLLACFAPFFSCLPDGPRAARLREIEAHLDETWICWMGGYDDWAPFYYRLFNPVAMVEFDHHQAVFLTNSEPARFHVHTLARTPNGGDYGMDLRNKFRSNR